jgi:hypothetical protein
MKDVRMGSLMLSAVPLAACTTAPAPNDAASRALNEMKAVAQPIPPKPDPRDTRIADLEQKNADFEAELAQVRPRLRAIWTNPKPEPTSSKLNSASATGNWPRSGTPSETRISSPGN